MIVFGIILILVGAIAFLVGWTILQKRRKWLRTTGRAAGLVADGQIRYDVGDKTYALRVTRTNLDGRRIPVRYALANPGQARPDSPVAVWLTPVFFLLLGSGLMLVGVGLVNG